MRITILAAIVLALACDSSHTDSASGSGSNAATTSPAASPAAVAEIAQQTLLSQPAGESLILDVRTPEEYAEGHVPNAINIPHDQLEAHLAELEGRKNGPVVVYCKSGRRAGLAAETLAKAGFTQLLHLTGDMQAWTAAGLPTEKAGS
ncbi:MAG: rhodanese-like domain-containing protein [Myxococcota bacterium]